MTLIGGLEHLRKRQRQGNYVNEVHGYDSSKKTLGSDLAPRNSFWCSCGPIGD